MQLDSPGKKEYYLESKINFNSGEKPTFRYNFFLICHSSSKRNVVYKNDYWKDLVRVGKKRKIGLNSKFS